MKKIFLILMIGILFFGICFVSSEEPPNYNYNDPDSYRNANFIQNSNPSNWDPNMVDFKNPEFQNRINFDESAMIWYQDNYCSGVCTITPQDQQLTYSDNRITHPNGNFASIEGYPPGTEFIATQNEIEVKLPESAVSVNIPHTDSVILRVPDRNVVMYSANCGKLGDCDVIKGLNGEGGVVVEKGRVIRILENTDATVKGINHKTSGNTLNLYYEKNFDASSHSGENYFNYGEGKILLGGDGFTSSLKEGNDIFPEYATNKYQHGISNTKRKARLEFNLGGGSLEVTKISQDNHPLALDIKSSGKSKIANGNWIFESDGNNVNAKLEDWHNFPLSSDIKLDYQDSNGISSTYKLDVNSRYTSPLSKQELVLIENEIHKLEDDIKINKKEIGKLQNIHSVKETSVMVEDFKSQEEGVNVKINDLIKEWQAAKKAGNMKQVAEVKDKIQLKQKELKKLRNSKYDLIDSNPDYKRLKELGEDNNMLKWDIEGLEESKKEWKKRTGVWGSILTSENGGFKGTHSEFIEGFPVLKNTDIYVYTFKDGKIVKTIRRGGENMDKLNLIVDSKLQTCADTQIELFGMYKLQEMEKGNIDSIEFQIANGKKLEYKSDGTYTIWGSKKIVSKSYKGDIGNGFDNWITNVQAYSNTGSLRASTDQIDVDDLRPGDLITLRPDSRTGYGHTKAVKEVLEIPPRSGRIYYRLFAGSDPAIDARIYKNLVSKKEFSDMVGKKDIEFSRFR
jgi:hypothetical protein